MEGAISKHVATSVPELAADSPAASGQVDGAISNQTASPRLDAAASSSDESGKVDGAISQHAARLFPELAVDSSADSGQLDGAISKLTASRLPELAVGPSAESCQVDGAISNKTTNSIPELAAGSSSASGHVDGARNHCTSRGAVDGRVLYFSHRLEHRLPAIDRRRVRPKVAYSEVLEWIGGATTGAFHLHSEKPKAKIGLMIAGNSGRPGGACGLTNAVRSIHANHKTQEEDAFSSWMIAEAGNDTSAMDRLFASTISNQYGLLQLDSESPETLQGVDYKNAKYPEAFADAWVVRDAWVLGKSDPDRFDEEKMAPCDLVFAAGPNAGASRDPFGSTARTFCWEAERDYGFFRECVAECLRTSLDAMIVAGVDIALIARVSCGIYAGPHRERINDEFGTLLDEVLSEPLNDSKNGCPCRGQCFDRVVIPMLARTCRDRFPQKRKAPAATALSVFQEAMPVVWECLIEYGVPSWVAFKADCQHFIESSYQRYVRGLGLTQQRVHTTDDRNGRLILSLDFHAMTSKKTGATRGLRRIRRTQCPPFP